MANLNKVEIPTAVPTSSHLDLSCDHVTTMNFGQMQPVHYRHVFKGENLDLKSVVTVRPFPLAAPTYGRMRLNIHHFFVPWRVVFPQWDTFYNDTIGVNADNSSLVAGSPYFLNSDVATLFVTVDPLTGIGVYSRKLLTYSSGDPYDFCSDASEYYEFTTFGKYFYKILTSLGYAINWDIKDSTRISALPLLAYCKIFVDYYANQSYLDSSDVIAVKKLLAYNDPVTPLNVGTSSIGLISLLISHVMYDQDYFTGAWDNPFAPNGGQYSAITFNDIVGSNYVTNSGFNGTPVMTQNNASSTNIGTQYLHDALKAISDYSKRHQLAGASNIYRTLAQWGFGVNHLKSDRSLHLGNTSIDIKTGAVYSTANTATGNDPSTLGDYAGNGFGNGVSGFNFKPEEFGIEISIASILPSGGYFQGMDENNMHIDKLQFYHPEFDGLATQLIRRREVYVSKNGTFGRDSSNNVGYDKGFGFTGRNGEQKRPRNWISGDLRCDTRFVGANSWHLMREFSDASFSGDINNVVHSLNFTRYTDAEQYKRIFTVTNSDNDPFIVEFHFAVGAYAPCRGLFETYDFDKGGDKVQLETNGAILN